MQNATTFSNFLAKRGVQMNCEVCKGNCWTMAEVNAGLSLALPVFQETSTPNPSALVPAYALICQKCGNIRLHATAVVDPISMTVAARG